MTQPNLFCRDPVSLSGYIPKFSHHGVLMEYRYEERKAFCGFGGYDDESPRIIKEHRIIVNGTKIVGRNEYYHGSVHAVVATIANEYIAGYKRAEIKPAAYMWLTENATDLSNSARYWDAMIRVTKIAVAKKQIEDLKNQVRIGEMLASVDAVGVLREETLSTDDRYLLAIEFGITPDEYYRG